MQLQNNKLFCGSHSFTSKALNFVKMYSFASNELSQTKFLRCFFFPRNFEFPRFDMAILSQTSERYIFAGRKSSIPWTLLTCCARIRHLFRTFFLVDCQMRGMSLFFQQSEICVCGQNGGWAKSTWNNFLLKPSEMGMECVWKKRFLRQNHILDTYWTLPKGSKKPNIGEVVNFRVWLTRCSRIDEKCFQSTFSISPGQVKKHSTCMPSSQMHSKKCVGVDIMASRWLRLQKSHC